LRSALSWCVQMTNQPPEGAVTFAPPGVTRPSALPSGSTYVVPGVGSGVAGGVGVMLGVTGGVAELDGVGVGEGVSLVVSDGVVELVGVEERDEPGDGVGEHESAAARPVAAHPPHGHGMGATDASGQ